MKGAKHMNTNENAILHTVPAAGALHKVPGFDPLQHLQRVVSDNGEQVLRLGLRYQRLWFRLACPSGRLLLNPLRITDQMAIFEAQVFFQREDPTPASSFTSTKTAQEDKAYIRTAQDEALSVALDNAGFGIQLCDVTQGADDGKTIADSQADTAAQARPQRSVKSTAEAVTPDQTAQQAADTAQPPQATVETATAVKQDETPMPADTAPAPAEAPMQAVNSASRAEPVQQQVAPAQQQAAPVQQQAEPAPQQATPAPASDAQVETQPIVGSAPHQEPEARSTRESPATTVLNFPVQQAEPENAPSPAENLATTAPAEAEAASVPAYTEDMSIEDISARMTVDEARKVVVTEGTCKGWTLEQVAERRPSSLKFYVTTFFEASNVFKAAATLMLQEVVQQKAG